MAILVFSVCAPSAGEVQEAIAQTPADFNFIINAIKADGSTDVAVNEIAPYTGTLSLDPTVITLLSMPQAPGRSR